MIYSEDIYPSIIHNGSYKIVITWSGPLDRTWATYFDEEGSWPITSINTNVYLQNKESVAKEVVRLGDEFVTKLKENNEPKR